MDKVLNVPTPKQKLLDQLTPRLPYDHMHPGGDSVLPANHPMLEKFQKALNEHLLKVRAQLTEDIADIDHNIDELCRERDEIGARIYDSNQELDRQTKIIDDLGVQLVEISEKRIHQEKLTNEITQEYDAMNRAFKNIQNKYNGSLLELTQVTGLEMNVKKWTKDMEEEVIATKRIVSKDKQDHIVRAQKKKQMDVLLYKLESEVKTREHELDTIDTQLKEQNDYLEVLNQSLADANADLESLHREHQQLTNAYNEVLIQIQLRDKAIFKSKDELKKEEENQKSIQANIDGTKKASAKEMNQNENLELFKSRLARDLDNLDKQLLKQNEENELLLEKINQMNAVLEMTESDIAKAKIEGQLLDNETRSLRSKLEKLANEKIAIEEQTLELLQEQMATDQASQNLGKKLRGLQERRRNVEITMFETEYKLSQVLLDLEKWKATCVRNKENIEELIRNKDEELKKLNRITDENAELKRSINIKLKTSDDLKIQLQKMIEAAGGQEIAPSEVKIRTLQKNIDETEVENRELQNFWLRLQSHVCGLAEKRSKQMNSIHLARTQLLVVEQKTLKIDAELDAIQNQDQELQRDLSKLLHDLDRMSAQLYEKRQFNEFEGNEFEYKHRALINRLKENETEMIQLQQELINRQHEVEEKKEMVLDKHREALSWETKWKMVVETKKYRDDEHSNASEIASMKAEIHRMEVRYAQLKRAQEKLAQDLENCVAHRDHIFDSAQIRSKMANAKPTKSRSTDEHRICEMKSKLRNVQMEINKIQKSLKTTLANKEQLMEDIKAKRDGLDDEKMQESMLQKEIEQSILLKQENLENILRIQNRAKRYQKIARTKQLPKLRSESMIAGEVERQLEINGQLNGILEKLLNDFPDRAFELKRIVQTLKVDEDILHT